MTDRRGRRGRRPGSSDTRQEILVAAREAFATAGYDATTIRRIAIAAQVDAALIHHYFGTKEQLFLAAVQFPLNPVDLIEKITTGPPESLGERLADTFLSAWDHPETGPVLAALLRGALTDRLSGRLVQEFFARQIAQRVGERLADLVDRDEVPARVTLAASQLFGLALLRYILRFEPLASLPHEVVVATVAPTLQRYLTGDSDR